MRSILVTGALGNLGWKAVRALAEDDTVGSVLACDCREPSVAQREEAEALGGVEFVVCDFGRWHDVRWRGRILDVDGMVHFAAQNPFPEASWQDVAVSMDMTQHLFTALSASDRPFRLVYVSSNHVMGQYKDSLFGSAEAAGKLTTSLEPGVGTVWDTGLKTIDSTGYATVKLAGERACLALATATQGLVSGVNVRVGWCQPGENHPRTLSAAGSITIERRDESGTGVDELAETDRWFREMWLSNGDFSQLMRKALSASEGGWPQPAVTVNGVSNNRGMVWSLDEGRDWLGYAPVDNVYDHLA